MGQGGCCPLPSAGQTCSWDIPCTQEVTVSAFGLSPTQQAHLG